MNSGRPRTNADMIIGIDPGTGITSPTGIAIFRSNGYIEKLATISSTKRENLDRLRDVAAGIKREVPNRNALLVIETFIMQGKGGQTLQRLIGAVIAAAPEKVKVADVFNTTVKRIVAGNGAAEKIQVAQGVLKWFKTRKDVKRTSVETVTKLISLKQWDILDALAIGIAGYEENKRDG